MNDSYVYNKKEELKFDTPEKQYVRKNIWLPYAQQRKIKNNVKFIKYFTFPGEKCLDVLLLKDNGLLKILPNGIYDADYLSFCEENSIKFTKIKNKLANARGKNLSFEALVGAGNPSMNYIIGKMFPRDVINLDFTGVGFFHGDSTISNRMDSIRKIFYIQKYYKCSFSLFITLAVVERHMDKKGKSELDKCLEENLNLPALDEFKKLFYIKYPDSKFNDQKDFLLLIAPKIIINFGFNEQFEVKCKKKCTYIASGNRTPMIKFVFDCEYLGSTNGYTRGSKRNNLEESYNKNITELLKTDYIDINNLFSKSPKLKEKYLKEIQS